MKYALLIVIALASTASAQCVNCQPTPAPPQRIDAAPVRPQVSILEARIVRQPVRTIVRTVAPVVVAPTRRLFTRPLFLIFR